MKLNENRNAEIDFFRILFAVVVVISHSDGLQPNDLKKFPFVGGYLAVEFFFILSGYFAVKQVPAFSSRYQMVPVWTWNKYKRIFTYVIPAVIIHYLINAYITGLSFFDTIKSLLYGVFEMFLFPMTGLRETFFVLPLWYLSAMLILLPLFYAALLKNKDLFLYVLCPVFALLIYGYYSVTTQHIARWSDWNGLFFMSLPRAWAGLCLGGIVTVITERLLCPLSFNKWGTIFLSGVEIICIGIVIFYMYTRSYRRLDFLCIGLIVILVSIILSEKASIHKIFPLLFSKISEFSLSLYVSHWTVRLLIPTVIMPAASYEARLLPYILLSAVYALLLMVFVFMVRRFKLPEKIRRLILQI